MRADQPGHDGSNLGAAFLLLEGLQQLRGIPASQSYVHILTDGNNNV